MINSTRCETWMTNVGWPTTGRAPHTIHTIHVQPMLPIHSVLTHCHTITSQILYREYCISKVSPDVKSFQDDATILLISCKTQFCNRVWRSACVLWFAMSLIHVVRTAPLRYHINVIQLLWDARRECYILWRWLSCHVTAQHTRHTWDREMSMWYTWCR